MFNRHWKNLHMSQQKCHTPSTNMHKLKQKNQLQQTKNKLQLQLSTIMHSFQF
jgi:hypothetical protein